MTQRWLLIMALMLTCMLTAACSSGNPSQQLLRDAVPTEADAAPIAPAGLGALPAIPQDTLPVPPLQKSANGLAELTVAAPQSSYGNQTRAAGNSMIVAADETGKFAWSWYTLGELDTDRPVQLTADVAPASILPEGPSAPLEYFVGVSNYSMGRWAWFGPLSGDASIPLNAENLRERFVSGADQPQMHIVVACYSEAGAAMQLDALAVQLQPGLLSSGYFPTRPILMEAGLAPSGDKAASLVESQYVSLTWNFIPDPQAPDNEATTVRVYRRLVGEEAWLAIGDANQGPIGETYVDPLDNDQGEEFEVTAGRTYQYLVRFFSTGGFNTSEVIWPQQIPLVAPQNLTATAGVDETTITLTWVKSEDATNHQIYRDTLDEPYAEVGDVDTYTDTECGVGTVHTYWMGASNAFAEVVDTENSAAGICLPTSAWTTYPLVDPGFMVDAVQQSDGTICILYGATDAYFLAQSTNAVPQSVSDWNITKVSDFTQLPDPSLGLSDLHVDENDFLHLAGIGSEYLVEDGEPTQFISNPVHGISSTTQPGGPGSWGFTPVDLSDQEFGSEKDTLTTCVVSTSGDKPQVAWLISTLLATNPDIVRFATSSDATPDLLEDWTVYTIDNSLFATYGLELQNVNGQPRIAYGCADGIFTANYNGFAYFSADAAEPASAEDWTLAWSAWAPIQGAAGFELQFFEDKPVVMQMDLYPASQIGLTTAPAGPADWQHEMFAGESWGCPAGFAPIESGYLRVFGHFTDQTFKYYVKADLSVDSGTDFSSTTAIHTTGFFDDTLAHYYQDGKLLVTDSAVVSLTSEYDLAPGPQRFNVSCLTRD